MLLAAGSTFAQVTVSEPEFINTYCILTSDATYDQLPKESGTLGEHKNKVRKWGKLLGGAANVIGAGGMIGAATAGSVSGVINGVRVASTAGSVASAAGTVSGLAGSAGMDNVFNGGSPTYTIQGVINYALKPNDETGELEQVEVLLLDPELYGDHLMNAFEAQLWASHPQRAEGKEIARLVSGGARQMIISDKEYSHALVPDQNGTAYIGKMTPELFDYVRSQDSFSPIDDIGGYSTSYDDIKDLDLPLLQQIYTAAVESGISGDGVVLRVDFKKFCRHMGKDVDAGGSQDVLGDINKFAGYVGIRPGTRKIQVLLVFMGYDKDTDTLDLGVPYMFSIMSEVARKNLIQGKKKTGEQFEYEKPHYNKLCHSTINKERNKAAVMLVYEITNGLLQRGSDSNGEERVTYRVKFRTLVNAVPQLRGRIIDRKTTSDKNKELKRAFEAAYRILEKRTDALQYFEGLEYEKTVPTMTTLDSKLVITFKGINRDFEPLQ